MAGKDACEIVQELMEALGCSCHHHSLPNVREWHSIRHHIGLAKDGLTRTKERMTVDEEKERPELVEAIAKALAAATEAHMQVDKIHPMTLPWPPGVI